MRAEASTAWGQGAHSPGLAAAPRRVLASPSPMLGAPAPRSACAPGCFGVLQEGTERWRASLQGCLAALWGGDIYN